MEPITEHLNSLERLENVNTLQAAATHLWLATRTQPPQILAPLLTERGVSALEKHALRTISTPARPSSIKALHNVLSLAPNLRNSMVKDDRLSKLIALFKTCTDEEQLPVSNILLYVIGTVSNLDVETLSENQLFEALIKNLQTESEKQIYTITPAIGSFLKLFSTLLVKYDDQKTRLSPAFSTLVKLLEKADTPPLPLEPPLSTLVYSFVGLPVPDGEVFSEKASRKLVHVCDLFLQKSAAFDEPQFLTLSLVLVAMAQEEGETEAKKVLREAFLPSEEDRNEVLGKGTSLPHRLIARAIDSLHSNLANVIWSIYFYLSGSDPSKFVHHVGFGNASGYLATQGIKISQDEMSGPSDDDAVPVNPITGQRLDKETPVKLPPMTDEEKEREAERLFVLFERLKASGVIDIENPVAEAARSGRLQELPDDYEEDDD